MFWSRLTNNKRIFGAIVLTQKTATLFASNANCWFMQLKIYKPNYHTIIHFQSLKTNKQTSVTAKAPRIC